MQLPHVPHTPHAVTSHTSHTTRSHLTYFTHHTHTHTHRHVSIGNIDDYSSGDSSTGTEVGRSRAVRRRRATLKPSPYRSEENLYGMEDERGTPMRVKSMYNMRPASSLVDLMNSFNGEEGTKYKVSVCSYKLSFMHVGT